MKSHLIIATYSGIRRYMYPDSITDRAFYIKKQIEQLQKLKHNLNQITFVVPENITEPLAYREFLSTIPNSIGSANVSIGLRKNIGMSYGSFSDTFSEFNTDYDYYLLLEDDYFFVQDNFDEILIKELEKKQCGYLCMHKGDGGGVYKMHAAVPMGIIKTSSAMKVWDNFGELPHAKDRDNYTLNEAGQVSFGNAFVTHGDGLEDLRDSYKCALSMLGTVHIINEHNTDYLCVPTQVLMDPQFNG